MITMVRYRFLCPDCSKFADVYSKKVKDIGEEISCDYCGRISTIDFETSINISVTKTYKKRLGKKGLRK